MAFTLRRNPHESSDTILCSISSTVVTLGNLLYLPVGSANWRNGDASCQHWMKKAIAQETTTTSDTEVNAIPVQPEQVWEVDASNNSNSTHDGDRMILGTSSASTINNTGTDATGQTTLVTQVGIAGAASDARILVQFSASTGIDPDAA